MLQAVCRWACDISLVYPRHIFYGWQFSTKPGWYVLSGRSIDVPNTDTRAGLHNDDTGRVGDPLHASEVGEDVPERTTRIHTPRRETMAQNTSRAGIFGHSYLDLHVETSRGRHGAERADPPTRGSGVQGGRPANKTLAKMLRGGRDPPTEN